MATVQRNESAASFAWLWERLGEPSRKSWGAIRGQMLSMQKPIIHGQDWVPDFWMARSSQSFESAILAPSWDPPESVDEWPTLGVEAVRGLLSARTNHSAFAGVMQENSASVVSDQREALEEFKRRASEIERHGDVRMIQGEHVRAWLSAALGNLLAPIVLTPPCAPEAFIEGTVNRLVMPVQFELPVEWVNDFEERRLALLYNARVTPDGNLEASAMRVGQGESWREHWGWLSTEIGAAEALEATRVAARLMRCTEVVAGLLWALQSDDEYLKTVALAVVRRWLLSLKAMAWLETALEHAWEAVRPQDLACFAFNALKPEWPRRMLGISHRSADVKAALMKMKVWGNSHVAIDANYVPAWETNTGMMWGLFASSPVIARIGSPRYRESVWCYREYEIIQYLQDCGDYMEERWVKDVTEESMVALDELLGDSEKAGSLSSFPPLCTVWTPKLMPEWQVKMMRAAGALRIVNLFSENRPEGVNRLAAAIADGLQLPGTGPTNNPGGWAGYAKVFADLRALTGVESEELPLRLPADYGEEEGVLDRKLSNRILDLSSGTPTLGDVLVAFEWYRVVWPVMIEQGSGDFLVINCQGWGAEQWITHERLSLFRGMAAIRAPVPIWFMQKAGQQVENWPLVGNRPIFTEHVSSQFGWMMALSLGPEEVQARYPSDSGLEFSDELAAMCANGGASRREA